MPETLAAQSEVNFYPKEHHPELRLVASDGALVEGLATPEIENIQNPTRYLGKVARESLEAEYDAITEMAELTDGQMRAPAEFTFNDQDLIGPDGRSATEVAENGLRKAREEAKKNPNLWFEVGRRSLELEEIKEFIKRLQEGTANTMLTTSDLPEALADAKEDVGGYNTERKLALARVMTVGPDGKIMMYSQTLDGSNRQGLEAIHAEFGFQAEPGELLGQRRFMTLSSDEQATIMDRITGVYDDEMTAQFGGEWYAGRTPADYRNTYDFVCQQHDLVEMYKQAKLNNELTDQFMYDLGATINARFSSYKQESAIVTQSVNIVQMSERIDYDLVSVQQEMYREGRIARSQGKTFSACGSTYKAEGLDESTEALLKGLGFGNNESESKSWHGGKKFKNAKCVSCKEVKREVGACRICEDCVKHPKGNLRTVQDKISDPKKAPLRKESAKVISLEEFREKKKAKAEAKSL